MLTKWFPTTLITLSSICRSTTLIPKSWISRAVSLSIFWSFSTITSPVIGLTIFSAEIWFAILWFIDNFLLNLYLPTLDRSYLFASKNSESIRDTALSTVGGSPGLNRLYISIRASSLVLVLSFSTVAFNLSSSPSNCCKSKSLPLSIIALAKILIGSFLVLSILIYTISLESVSYSSQAPLFGITVAE